jgi:hypothetical protein
VANSNRQRSRALAARRYKGRSAMQCFLLRTHGMTLRGFFCVMDRMQVVAMRDMGMTARLFMVTAAVALGRFEG